MVLDRPEIPLLTNGSKNTSAAASPRELEWTTSKRKGKAAVEEPQQGELESVHYRNTDCAADLTLDPSNETLWATRQQIADAFGISTNTVGSQAEIIRLGPHCLETDRTAY